MLLRKNRKDFNFGKLQLRKLCCMFAKTQNYGSQYYYTLFINIFTKTSKMCQKPFY